MQVKRMGVSGYQERIFKHSKYITHYCHSWVHHTSLILNNGVTGTTQKVLLGTGAPITTSDHPQCSWYVVMPAYCTYNHIRGQSYCQDYACVCAILLR